MKRPSASWLAVVTRLSFAIVATLSVACECRYVYVNSNNDPSVSGYHTNGDLSGVKLLAKPLKEEMYGRVLEVSVYPAKVKASVDSISIRAVLHDDSRNRILADDTISAFEINDHFNAGIFRVPLDSMPSHLSARIYYRSKNANGADWDSCVSYSGMELERKCKLRFLLH